MADQDDYAVVEAARHNRSRPRVDLIDLTGDDDDDDSPPLPQPNRRRHASQRRFRPLANAPAPPFPVPSFPAPSFGPNRLRPANPRRTAPSFAPRPPSFHRSDSSILGGVGGRAHDVIDLTADSPEPVDNQQEVDADVLMLDARRLRRPSEPRAAHDGDRPGGNAGGGGIMGIGGGGHLPFPLPGLDHLFNLIQGRVTNRDPDRGLAAQGLANGFGRDSPNLDYRILPFGQDGAQPARSNNSAKPAREGYTRDNGEETVTVCPHCEKELEYDPNEEKLDPMPSERKRAEVRGEHHFWAVKSCGHVFCQECFENRRPPARSQAKGFPVDPNKASAVLCAVDGCDSDVTSVKAWVGIFL